jgi:probable HAF family extracellular repeat protein
MKTPWVVAVLAGISAMIRPAIGQSSFRGLGDLPGGILASRAMGVSGDGSVVVGRGAVDDGRNEAFRWTAAGGMVGLGFYPNALESVGLGSNVDGSIIVGSTGSQNPFRWTAATGIEPLTGLDPLSSWANGVSGDGLTVVGGRASGDIVTRAYRWTQAEGPVELSGHPAGSTRSQAFAANGDGSVIVGDVQLAPGRFGAFRWTQSTGMVVFGDTPGFVATTAYATNPSGTVIVGTHFPGTGDLNAFRWTQAGGMELLTGLPGGEAFGVSADGGVIVGDSNTASGFGGAFVWMRETGMVDLRSYLLSRGVADVAGWQLEDAVGVSGDGRVIVGYGRNPAGSFEAYMAVIPSPWTAPVLLLGVVAVRRRR